MVLLPLLFQMVADAFDSDQDDEQFLGVPATWWRAVILGPANSIPLVGDLLLAVVNKALGLKNFSNALPVYSIIDDVVKAIPTVDLEDIDMEEFLKRLRPLLSAVGKYKGLPLQTAFDITSSIYDAYVGEYEKALLKSLGYSPYRAEQISED